MPGFDKTTRDVTTRDQQSPNPNGKLVKVFDTEEEPEALVVKGLLDSAGIVNDLASASILQDAFPGLGGMVILVREEDANRARTLIADQRRASAEDRSDEDRSDEDDSDDDSDDDATEELPAKA
jgi:hypothetical protein